MKALLCYRCMHVVSGGRCSCGNCTATLDEWHIEDHGATIEGYLLDGYFVKDADTVEEILLSKVRNKIELSITQQLFLMERGQDENSQGYSTEV